MNYLTGTLCIENIDFYPNYITVNNHIEELKYNTLQLIIMGRVANVTVILRNPTFSKKR